MRSGPVTNHLAKTWRPCLLKSKNEDPGQKTPGFAQELPKLVSFVSNASIQRLPQKANRKYLENHDLVSNAYQLVIEQAELKAPLQDIEQPDQEMSYENED